MQGLKAALDSDNLQIEDEDGVGWGSFFVGAQWKAWSMASLSLMLILGLTFSWWWDGYDVSFESTDVKSEAAAPARSGQN